jgi:carbonic anhydrase/MFS family permease
MASININEINGIEGINIGGTAILCSSNPNCILKFDYKDNQNCKVSKVGNILSIDFPNSDNKIEALKNTWILKKILVRGPPKIFNTFNNNAIINNSLQFDFVHSLENKKAKANTYVIVSVVAQVNDIYSNTTTYNAVNRINIPSSANNNQATDLNISPSDFFPENENPFYQYNIPKTTNVNQIYINTIRSMSTQFFNNFNNRVLGGNYEQLFSNYLDLSQLPVSPNPIFFNQNTPFQPLGNIEQCRSGCRAPNGKIIGPDMNNNENQNSGTGAIIPTDSTFEPLDAKKEGLPAKCFQKKDQSQTGTSTGNDTQEEEVKCTTMVKVGGKNLSTTQMITTCIFAAVIAVGVTFIIWKMGKNGNNVNSNSNWVNISIFTSWIGIFIIFLAYYIALNGRKWDTYKENEEAAKKKRDAYSGFTWATLFISMIILSCVAFYYVFSNKFNLPSFVKSMFKYAPIIILIAISITAIVLGVKSYGETCKRRENTNTSNESNVDRNKNKLDKFNIVICFGIIVSLFKPVLLLLIRRVNSKILKWIIYIIFFLMLAGITVAISIFASKKDKLIQEIQNKDLPKDPDCRTSEQKSSILKFKNTLRVYLGLLITIIPMYIALLIQLGSFLVTPLLRNVLIAYSILILIYLIIFVSLIKSKKYKNGETLPQICKKIDVDLNPLLITMGCSMILWVGILIYFIIKGKVPNNVINSINNSNLSNSDRYALRSAIGNSLFSTQSNRNKAVDILKSNPALAKSLANQGYTLDKIQNPKLADAFSTQMGPLNSGVSKKTGILNVNTFNRKLGKSSLPKNDQNFLKKLVSEPNPSQMDLNRVGGILAKDPSLKTYLDNKGIDLSKGAPTRIPSLSTSAVTY